MPKKEKAPASLTTATIAVRAGGRESEPVSVTHDIPRDLDSLVAKYSAEVVAGKAVEKIIINLQDYLRGKAKSDPNADLQALADEWRPGIRSPRGKSKTEKAYSLLESMSPEEKKALLESLQG